MLRCADDTLYTGVTTDPERRLREHNAGGKLGARYTRARRPVELAYQELAADKAEAYRREAAIKKLKREAKLATLLPSPSGGGGTTLDDAPVPNPGEGLSARSGLVDTATRVPSPPAPLPEGEGRNHP
ncbi:MAG: GIY-YIG nuclease family protein [Gammaproteobacteria bacterium]|nr:GIY-YIG nuclease family protein [Gammaproteobacteria bacterium]